MKTNPKKIPRTQADVDKAFDTGCLFGLEFTLNLILYVLKDKHNAPNEDILTLRDEFMYANDSVAKKYLSYADIKRCLDEEYDLAVKLVDRGKNGEINGHRVCISTD